MDLYTSEEQIKKKRHSWRIKLYILGGGIGLLGILIFYVVSVSPIFKIKVEIIGHQRLSQERLLEEIYDNFSQGFLGKILGPENYLAWPKKISLKNPLLAKLTVEKSITDKKITLIVEERQPSGIWCFNSQKEPDCYWFDKEGVLFESAPAPEGHLILHVDYDQNKKVPLGESPIKKEWLSVLNEAVNFFQNQNIPIKSYSIMDSLEELRAKTLIGADIRFSLRFSPQNSLAALVLYLQKNNLRNVGYIDLTVENRMYVKSE